MIYLDNAATTPMDPQVIDVVSQSLEKDFANSGTVYKIGLDARGHIEKAIEDIRGSLSIPPRFRIVFTSGGSESNNLFIKGLCFPDKKVASLGLEHPSVMGAIEYFKEFGNASVCLLDHQKEGRLDRSGLSALKQNSVKLLCLSHVNNELGSVNDPGPIVKYLQNESPKTRLFLDGVQAVGKLPISMEFWEGIAGYSVSGHKLNGPKGIGLLIYDSRLALAPLMHGGKQQYGVRSGTLPVPLIKGIARSVELAVQRQNESHANCKQLRNRLVEGLKDCEKEISGLRIRFNSLLADDTSRQSPAIVNFSFPPVEGEVLLHHLEGKNIYVGLGSACSAHSNELSKILMGIGLTEEEARCSLRISFGRQNSIEEVDAFLREFTLAYKALYPSFKHKLAKP